MHPKYGNNDRCCIDYKLVVRLWLKISHRMPMKFVKTEGVNDRIAMLKAMAEDLKKNRANVVSSLGFSSINAYTVLSVKIRGKCAVRAYALNPRNQMARERQKWTTEEEQALFAGVEKYGQGKWKVILTDPQFASILTNRSNIDLKDKWRNIIVNRDKVKTCMSEDEVTIKSISPSDSPKPLSAVHLIDNGGTSTPSKATIDRRISPDYEAMVFEALFSTKDPNGADTNEILSFIQQRYELPDNFKRSVTLMLRRLTLSGELEKVDNHFTIYKGESFSDEAPKEEDVGPCEDKKMDEECEDEKMEEEKDEEMDKCDSPIGTETMEDAALYAAITVARAENTMQKAIEACQEADSFVDDVEESIAMLRVAEELHKKCKEDGFVMLAP
ncbi:hypothetical protein LXL04_008255 [Taraxacum kok-saghyz]